MTSMHVSRLIKNLPHLKLLHQFLQNTKQVQLRMHLSLLLFIVLQRLLMV